MREELNIHIKKGVIRKKKKIDDGCEIFVKRKLRKRCNGLLANEVTLGHIYANSKGKKSKTIHKWLEVFCNNRRCVFSINLCETDTEES